MAMELVKMGYVIIKDGDKTDYSGIIIIAWLHNNYKVDYFIYKFFWLYEGGGGGGGQHNYHQLRTFIQLS